MVFAQNTICITADAQALDAPLIPESRLPQKVLERLQRVCLILDCTATYKSPFSELDPQVLSAFINVQHLRVAVVLRTDGDAASQDMRDSLWMLLSYVIQHAPPRARIEYGVVAGSDEERIADELKIRRQKTFRHEQRVVVVVVPGSELAEMTLGYVSMFDQGCHSGGVADVFAEYRGQR
jgi:hypothetical protein